MSSLLDRIDERDGHPVLRGEVPLAEVEARLKAGESPDRVVESRDLDPADFVAAMARLGLGPEGDEGPPLVRSRPTRPWLQAALADDALARLLPRAGRPGRLALAAGLLQVHDFWDASHASAQEADDLGEPSVSAYWHGIAHRREPDPGNASYWFRRVGQHPVLAEFPARARPLLDDARAARLIRGGSWDPFAFIAFCGEARPGPTARLARRLQRLEMIALLDDTWGPLATS